MSIISSVSYLLINWLDDYSKCAAAHLPFTSPGTLEWAAVNASQVLCVSQDKYPMVIHVPWGQRVSSLASERGFPLPLPSMPGNQSTMSWNTGLSLAGEEVQSSHGWAVTIYPPRRPTAGGLGPLEGRPGSAKKGK